jgi:hypothetical protein
MGIKSINEPDEAGRLSMVTPVSINEPPDPAILNPVIAALTPDSCTIGQPDFTLFVSGTGFSSQSVIHFAGHDEPTTLNADGTLSTGVKPSLWLNPVVVQCQVRNGPVMSNAVDFTFAPEDTPAELSRDDDDGRPHHRKKR